ncbi:MAG: hypothetical protein ACOCXH_14170 [Cyclobacteriaceae bacterium]
MGWKGSRLNGYAKLGKYGEPGIIAYDAKQDYIFIDPVTNTPWEIFLDFDISITAGARVAAIIDGAYGIDINMYSVNLWRYNFIDNRTYSIFKGDFEYSVGASIASNGFGGGGGVRFSVNTKTKEKRYADIYGYGAIPALRIELAADLMNLKAKGMVAGHGAFSAIIGAEITTGLQIRQHNSWR